MGKLTAKHKRKKEGNDDILQCKTSSDLRDFGTDKNGNQTYRTTYTSFFNQSVAVGSMLYCDYLPIVHLLLEKLTTKHKGEIMGKGKSMMSYPWLTVYQTMKCGDISYFEQSISGDLNQSEIQLPSIANQESETIKKDLITNLSGEAKEVVKLILSSPMEILETFQTPKYKTISKQKIKEHLAVNGWPPRRIEKVFSELKTFVMDLEST